VTEFKEWLAKHWLQGVKKFQSGGRVDIEAFMIRLAAYRLVILAADQRKLREFKKAYVSQYGSNENSLSAIAENFRSHLSQWIPSPFIVKPDTGVR
jgi:hypothetical protein